MVKKETFRNYSLWNYSKKIKNLTEETLLLFLLFKNIF